MELFYVADIKDGFLELISHWMDGTYGSLLVVGGVWIVWPFLIGCSILHIFSGLDIGGRGCAGWCNILDIMEVGIELVSIIDFMKRKNIKITVLNLFINKLDHSINISKTPWNHLEPITGRTSSRHS